MSNVIDVTVQSRSDLGSANSRRLRKAGNLPAVVYGLGVDAASVTVEPKAISKILHSEAGLNTVVNLRLEGTEETRHVMIKDVDRHPITDRLTHIDFLRIDMDKEVSTVLPIEVEGTPEGVKLGGVLTVVRHEIGITCLPKYLRGSVRADISGMGLNDTLRVGDLPQYEGVVYSLGPERTVATVRPKGAEETESSEEETEEEVA